jgi:RHS repeat-associated protein
MPITNFFWDGDNLLQEYDDAGVTTAQYSTEPGSFGNVSSQRRSGQSHYYHHDPLGSTTELTNASGDVTDSRRYKAFGATVEQSGSTTFPFQYVGEKGYYFDAERGTHYVRRRDLRAIDGRWLSVDPLDELERWLLAYIYSLNRPLNLIDPSGLQEEECGTPGCQCCCCAEAVSIPRATITDLDELRVRSRTDPFPPLRAVWGKQFVVAVETTWKIFDVLETKDMDCVLEWWERVRTQPPNERFGRWINKMRTVPDSPTFDGWNARPRTCPGSATARIIDQPSIGLGQGNVIHEIFIAIKVKSNPDCDCKEPSVATFAYARFRTIGGVGDVRDVTPLEDLPREAGKPPGF